MTKPHRPPTFYDYDNPDGNPRVPANCGSSDGHSRRQANFNHSTFIHSDKKQDLLNHSGAYFRHNMQNTATFRQGMQQQKKKKKWQENTYSQSNPGGCLNRRQWHQAGPREGLPSKGRGRTKKNEPLKPVSNTDPHLWFYHIPAMMSLATLLSKAEPLSFLPCLVNGGMLRR